ncbi:hypothetical protein CcaverHIS002_0502170 [Cutaneotrichosporon cavernicola]|uniref:Acid protease n=1 Tax=Cutaneotrichosporon cavernicola TaxID=279322 RepID=A0AA48L658_9TREE|nr:uncharacterized protein CcaverHIS019_0502750 [Cutaneotrichosporon cavernicola]BEI84816.1 hypothetical protein CcaverHIS002_0502170 [Cutaneotrichosporon cavernicola]BEI92647.1 hypothetical protein CcaverHIS019_0502750 [Cutaneotrichosporon cavernicola]BEJ00422.1 hypothetical protein CcaverHIS631_0502790 [Cutaneotrichosporon cavernicola]BEJ08191.1 hypothetical protein CcaverHIS641_0502760 [Cutaneotrichosporon cavernicola]
MMMVWAAFAATWVVSTYAFEPNVTFIWEVPPMSPLIQFDPPDAWVDTYPNINDSLYTPGVMGKGFFPLITAGPGCRAYVEYIGSMFVLQGSLLDGATMSEVIFELDGVQQTGPMVGPSLDVLGQTIFGMTNLDTTLGPHVGSLRLLSSAPPQSRLAVGFSLITAEIVARSAAFEETSCLISRFPNGDSATPAGAVHYTGSWQTRDNIGGVGGQATVPYYEMYANNTPSVQFPLPPSTNILYINGTVGPSYGRYSVNIDPKPPYWAENNGLNAHRRYVELDQLFYFSSLDPEVNYTVTITGDPDGSKILGLSTWTVCFLNDPQFFIDLLNDGSSSSKGVMPVPFTGNNTFGSNNTLMVPTTPVAPVGSTASVTNTTAPVPPVTSPAGRTNVGAIAGGVVGGVLGAGLLAGLVFIFCRRRKDQDDLFEGQFVVDATEAAVTPYKTETGYMRGSNEGYALHSLYGPVEPHGDRPSLLSGSHSKDYGADFQEKYPHLQNVAVDYPKHPIQEETAQALLLAFQRHRESSGVNQEEDAGPISTIPPSYNPEWMARQSGQSDSSVTAGLSSPPLPTEGTDTTYQSSRDKWEPQGYQTGR